MVSVAVAFCYGAVGIACMMYATQWAKPPEVCDTYVTLGDFDCDVPSLTAIEALSAVNDISILLHITCMCAVHVHVNSVLETRQNNARTQKT